LRRFEEKVPKNATFGGVLGRLFKIEEI